MRRVALGHAAGRALLAALCIRCTAADSSASAAGARGFATAAGARNSEDPELPTKGVPGGGPVCTPKRALIRLVLVAPGDGSDYIYEGPPQKAEGLTKVAGPTLPQSCLRWETEEVCCTTAFFRDLVMSTDDEARRFATIIDVYEHFVSDHIAQVIPDVRKTGKEESAKALEAARDVLIANQAPKKVVDYIAGCEDTLRRHFAATTCELCNPKIANYLTDDRYLQVNSASCDTLADACKNAPKMLTSAAKYFDEAAAKMKALVDSGENHPGVLHASRWIGKAAQQVKATAIRIARKGYADKEALCKNVADAGYGYRHKEWGNLDLLHPSMAGVAEGPTDVGLTDTAGQQRSGAVDEGVGKKGDKTDANTKQDTRGRCKNGFEEEGRCRCEPCWKGSDCSEAAPDGPMDSQVFTPLVAQEGVQSSGQLIQVIGCRMSNADSQLARIKLLALNPNAKKAINEDPCTTFKTSPRFPDVPDRVPTLTSETRRAYLVRAAPGTEGRYAVCYCSNAECSNDLQLWRKLGEIEVFHTASQRTAHEQAIMQQDTTLDRITEKTTACENPLRMLNVPAPTITCIYTSEKATFQCADNFAELEGPKELVCQDGAWYVPADGVPQNALDGGPEKPSSEHGADGRQPTATVWQKKLPSCMAVVKACDPNALPKFQDVEVDVKDGVATFQCRSGVPIVKGGAFGLLTEGQSVRIKDGGQLGKIVKGEVVEGGLTTNKYQVRLDTGKDAGMIEASDLEQVFDGSADQIACTANGWPAVRYQCLAPTGSVLSQAEPILGQDKEHVLVDIPNCKDGCDGEQGAGLNSGSSNQEKSSKNKVIEETIEDPTSNLELASGTQTHLGYRRSPSEPSSQLEMQENASLPVSFLEVGSSHQVAVRGNMQKSVDREAFLQEERGAAADSASLHIAQRRILVVGLDAASVGLQMLRWPVRFSKDTSATVSVDRCWVTQDCANGQIPADAAASEFFVPQRPHAGPLPAPVAVWLVLAMLASLVVGVAVLGGCLGCSARGCVMGCRNAAKLPRSVFCSRAFIRSV